MPVSISRAVIDPSWRSQNFFQSSNPVALPDLKNIILQTKFVTQFRYNESVSHPYGKVIFVENYYQIQNEMFFVKQEKLECTYQPKGVAERY